MESYTVQGWTIKKSKNYYNTFEKKKTLNKSFGFMFKNITYSKLPDKFYVF